MTCRRVVPFNRTGCNCNVAGGKIAAPTDTPVGGTVHPHRLYSSRCLAMNHRRYIAYPIHPHGLYWGRPRNGTQAVPYNFADWCIFSTDVLYVCRLNNCQLSTKKIVNCQFLIRSLRFRRKGTASAFLLHRYAFRQIPWFIYVQALGDADVVAQQL